MSEERDTSAEAGSTAPQRPSAAAELVVLRSCMLGAACAFASLLKVTVQDISGPAENLAYLAVGASILHGVLVIVIALTSNQQDYIRAYLLHISGALLSGSLFGGLASIWH